MQNTTNFGNLDRRRRGSSRATALVWGVWALAACGGADPMTAPVPPGTDVPGNAMPPGGDGLSPGTETPAPGKDGTPAPDAQSHKTGLKVGDEGPIVIDQVALDPVSHDELVRADGNRQPGNVGRIDPGEVPANTRRVRFAIALRDAGPLLAAISDRSRGRDTPAAAAPLQLSFDDGSKPVPIGLLLPAVQKVREAAARAKGDGTLVLDLLLPDGTTAWSGGVRVAVGDIDGDGTARAGVEYGWKVEEGESIAPEDGTRFPLPDGFSMHLDDSGRLTVRDVVIDVPDDSKLRRWRASDGAGGGLDIVIAKPGDMKRVWWHIPTPGTLPGTLAGSRLPLQIGAATQLLPVPTLPAIPTPNPAQLFVSRSYVFDAQAVADARRRLSTFPPIDPNDARTARATLAQFWNGSTAGAAPVPAARPLIVNALYDAVVQVNEIESLLSIVAQPKLQMMLNPMQSLFMEGKAALVGDAQFSTFAATVALAAEVPLQMPAAVGGTLDMNALVVAPKAIAADGHFPRQALLQGGAIIPKFSQSGLFPAQINPPDGDDLPMVIQARLLLLVAAARDFDTQAAAFIKAVDAAVAAPTPDTNAIQDIVNREKALKAIIEIHAAETLKRYNMARSLVGLAWI